MTPSPTLLALRQQLRDLQLTHHTWHELQSKFKTILDRSQLSDVEKRELSDIMEHTQKLWRDFDHATATIPGIEMTLAASEKDEEKQAAKESCDDDDGEDEVEE